MACTALLTPTSAAPQGTLDDYRRAATIRQRLEGLTIGVPETPNWISDTNRSWYRRSVTGGNDFVLVDAATQQKQPASDHARLATGLSTATRQDGQAIEADVGDTRWRCSLGDFACDSIGAVERGGPGFGGGGFGSFPGNRNDGEPRVSPDGLTEAFIHNY